MARLDAKAIAGSLGKAKRSGKGFMCCCPAHDDNNPSLFVCDNDNGGITVKCRAGCSSESVRERLADRGLMPDFASTVAIVRQALRNDSDNDNERAAAPVPEGTAPPEYLRLLGWEPTLVHEYRDQAGSLLMIVARHDRPGGGKEIRPLVCVRASDGTASWRPGSLPAPRPLYGLRRLATHPNHAVLVVEGEKTADAAAGLFPDYVVVTWPGGANALGQVHLGPLRGRDLVLWPDNDEPGRKAMAGLATTVGASAKSIRLVQVPPAFPPCWDLADPPPPGSDLAELINTSVRVHSGLRQHIMTARDLARLQLPPQEFLIDPWLPKGGLAMVWATRGIGKTWFALSLAISVSGGKDFLGYGVPKPERVLFIDGEMSLAELKERVGCLTAVPPSHLLILPSEPLFAAGVPLNINDEGDQKKILDAIERLASEGLRPSLVVLDNLSSLTRGIDENDNSALDKIIKWFLQMRHMGLTILIVHHATKAGDQQRGASRREDQLNTAIKLTPPDPNGLPADGAHFVMEFTKVRGRPPKPWKQDLRLVEEPGGRLAWARNDTPPSNTRDDVLHYIAAHRPSSQAAIVEGLGLSKSTISKTCTILARADLIFKNNLSLTSAGSKYVLKRWPDLASKLDDQDDIPF